MVCVVACAFWPYLLDRFACPTYKLGYRPKQTIHVVTLVTGDKATRSSVHKKTRATFYKSLGNRPPVYLKAACRMYCATFHAQHAQTIMLLCRQQQKSPHV